MYDPREWIERGLELYQSLIAERDELELEFQTSRTLFFGEDSEPGSDPVLADRRHLEWFVLERPSDALGGVPAEALLSEWLDRADAMQADHTEAFLQSHAGAFEVTSADPGRGIWVRDLLGAGEYPIHEPDAASGLRPSDLLVGRLFPIGDGVFLLSPAVGCFRSSGLVDAVREDMQRLRASRRGVLRIEQVELERLFFGAAAQPGAEPASDSPDVPVIDLAAERERARAGLEMAGVPPAQIEPILEVVRSSAREGRPVVVEVLNALAMDTRADLERARRALVELWGIETHNQGAGVEESALGRPPKREGAETGCDAAEALAAFDAGRARGEDLEGLFARLASDLGVEAPTDDADTRLAPDFPGVVGAMVEEFLWDIGRERGGTEAERLACLRRLSDYGSGLGVFESLGRREVLDFAGRWLLDEGNLSGPEEARAVLHALGEFCHWCEDRHEHQLWSAAGDLVERLAESVPRLVLARQHTEAASAADAPWEIRSVGDGALHLVSQDRAERNLPVPAILAELLRPGDLVHAREEAGALSLSACYPAELFELLGRPN
ncbi:MAG TPA: hypothetical protein ENJ09_01665 [Planctomycetes bacterium]|nr:hypothetical protein [Planctomycetota bacterium]